jgi:hypothetical protein
MTDVLVPKSAESFIRVFMHSWKMVRRETGGWFLNMASTPDLSNNDGRERRGVAMTCALFLQVLLMGGALLVGSMLPVESLAAHGGYALTDRPAAWAQPEKAIVNIPCRVAGVRVPKLEPPAASKLLVLTVANLDVPKIWHTTPLGFVPTSPLPAPALGLDGPPPPKKIAVHTGLFGGAVESSPAKRSVEKVQTGVFGSARGFPDRAEGENPGAVPK